MTDKSFEEGDRVIVEYMGEGVVTKIEGGGFLQRFLVMLNSDEEILVDYNQLILLKTKGK